MRPIISITCLLGILLLGICHTAQGKNYRWSDDMSPEQRLRVQEIMQQAAPKIKALRGELQQKLQKLKDFAYTNGQDQYTLAILGQELQEKRKQLRQELKKLDEKIFKEVGVSLHGYRGRDCIHLTKDNINTQKLLPKAPHASSHHIEN